MKFRVSFIVVPVISLIMLNFSGCGIYNRGKTDYGPAALSNTTVAEKAIEQAFLNSGIPASADSIKYSLIINGDKNGMVSSTGAEYLFSKGWNLNVKQYDFPAVTINLDTVFVRISSIKSGKVKSVLRKSEARISVEIKNSANSKKVYSGTGFYEDNPPESWVKSSRARDDLVTYSSGFGNTSSIVLPMLYSLTGTVIIWLFYSYRN